MSFVNLSETELGDLVAKRVVGIEKELLGNNVDMSVRVFRRSLWEQLGSAKNKDELTNFINNKQIGHRTFDPRDFDQNFVLHVGDHAVLIKDLKSGEAQVHSISHIEEDMGRYFYKHGIYLDGFPLNHYISPELFRGISNFVDSFVEQYRQKLIVEKKAKYLEVLKRERRPFLKSLLLLIGGISLWEKGQDKLQREFSDKLEVDEKSSLFQDIMFKLLVNNRATYKINPRDIQVGTKYICIRREFLERPAQYLGEVIVTNSSDSVLYIEQSGKPPIMFNPEYYLFDIDLVALLQIDAYKAAKKARKLLINGLLAKFK